MERMGVGMNDIKEIRFYKQRNNGSYNKTPHILEEPSKWEIIYDKYSKKLYANDIGGHGRWEIDYHAGHTIKGDYKTIIYPLIEKEWQRRQEAKKKEAEAKEKAIVEKINTTIPSEFAPFVDFLRKNMKICVYNDEWDYNKTYVGIYIKDILLCEESS